MIEKMQKNELSLYIDRLTGEKQMKIKMQEKAGYCLID